MREGLLIAAGYVLGSLPFGYWLPLALRRVDIRTVGSGNVGASNVWRTFGARLGLRGRSCSTSARALAAGLLGRYLGDELIGVLAGTAALAGHWRPLFLGFARGGKVVATTGGVAARGRPARQPLRVRASGSSSFLVDALRVGRLDRRRRRRFRCSRSRSTRRGRCSASRSARPPRSCVLHRGNIRRLLRGRGAPRDASRSAPRLLRRRSAASL